MELVITPKKLWKLISCKKDILIIDCRPFQDYIAGHVPGAVNLDTMQFHWIDTSKTGINHFTRQMKILLSNIGVTKDRFVIFYDDVSGPYAARGVWLLLYFTYNKVAMLDGGFKNWKAKYPVEEETNPFVPAVFRAKQDPAVLADVKKIKSSINKRNSILLDARSQEEYTGTVVRAARAGHIPSSINIDWKKNIRKDGTFKTKKELARLYSQIPKNSKVITYCQGGYRAANTFIALKILDFKDVSMYLGSWGEWGNIISLPSERG